MTNVNLVWDIFRDSIKGFVKIGIASLETNNEGKETLVFYTIFSKEKDLASMNKEKTFELHKILKSFNSYQEKKDSKGYNLGIKEVFVSAELMQNCLTLIKK